VAASDRQNAFTGFAGSEMKKLSNVAKDDRPEDKLSFAATNLVKPDLQSRARQQSEPPLNRNVFPPTPPPESDNRRSAGEKSNGSNGSGPMSRAQSVRGGGPKPQPLNLGRAAFERKEEQPQRRGTQRSASERPQPSRKDTVRTRDADRRDDRRENRPKPRRRGSDDDYDEYANEVVDDYYQPRSSRPAYTRSRTGKSSRPAYIDEEDEDEYDGSDVDDADFEMVSRSKTRRRSPARSTTSSGRGGTGGKVRVKVHASDTRYVFITPNTSMRDFVQSIREKFGLRQNFKVEIKDDGDMITMADEDDLDMAIQTAKGLARKEGTDVPKMEVWLTIVPSTSLSPNDAYMQAPLNPQIVDSRS
jgi:hypothetical protein